MEDLLSIFPPHLKEQMIRHVKKWDSIEEIRIRVNRPVEIAFSDCNQLLHHVIPDEKDSLFIMNQLSQHSIYRMEEELRQGYITLKGGHRVGLAGKVNLEGGRVKNIRYFSSFNIRIARPVPDAAVPYLDTIYQNQRVCNTLLIGPPKCGKTTFLRDLTRIISNGTQSYPSKKVGVIDERSEIAACKNGIPQQDVGLRTDVMDACPKAEGMMMMIRSMSPEVLVVDEIGSSQDVQAVMEALHAGVSVIATVHGDHFHSIKNRPSLQPLFHHQAMQRFIVFSNIPKPGTVIEVLNEMGQPLNHNVRRNEHETTRGHSIAVRYNVGRL